MPTIKNPIPMKQEVLDKLEEARDLVVEARYIIDELIPQYNILDLKDLDILKEVTDLIKILSEIKSKTKVNPEVPFEGMYKMLYCDYKKACEEKKELRKDIRVLMAKKEMDKDSAMLNLQLIRAEREREKLNKKLESRKQEIERIESKNRELKRKLKANKSNTDSDSPTGVPMDMPSDDK